MPHQPNTVIVAQGKPSVLLGAPSGSKILLKGVGAFKTTSLSEITDVDLSAVATGDFLRHNGSVFVNVTLTDTDIPDDLTLGTVSGNVAFTGNILPGADVIMTTTTAAFYLGDPLTNGSWRIMRDIGGTEDLLIQERVSNSWVTKGSFAT